MRNTIWVAAIKRHPAGAKLPRHLLALRFCLFPLDFLRWRLAEKIGYDPFSDTWAIHGIRYSGEALRHLANANGEIYRIRRDGDIVTLERMDK